MDMISLKEASVLVNKGAATVRRLAKANQDMPQVQKMPSRGGFTYYVDRAWILKYYKQGDKRQKNERLNETGVSTEIIDTLKDQLTKKDEQINALLVTNAQLNKTNAELLESSLLQLDTGRGDNSAFAQNKSVVALYVMLGISAVLLIYLIMS